MPTPTPDLNAIADTMREAMLGHFIAEDFDIVVDPNATTVTLSTDDWTLFLNRSEQLSAWIAIDDEPTHHDDLQTALDRSLGVPGRKALTDANDRLNRLISDALGQSGDRFSRIVAVHLSNIGERTTEQ
ncbi:hypothetical protein BH23CHL5_BH23CHL5_09450 [soil metagenome]